MPMQPRDGKNKGVQSGLKIGDHERVMHDLDVQFAQFASLMPKWERLWQGDSQKTGRKWSPSQRNRAEVEMETRFAALKAMPQPLRIELHTADIVGAKKAILAAVGVPHEEVDEKSQTVKDENGRTLLQIEPYRDTQLTNPLPEGAMGANPQSRRGTEDVRREYITHQYPQREHPTGALIMLMDYRKTSMSKRDPKKAIRSGLARTGRVSQFYTPRKEKETDLSFRSRTENAVGDLLRMLGYRYNPYYVRPKKLNLPEAVDLTVFWLFQRNAKRGGDKKMLLPMVVYAPAGEQGLRVLLPRDNGKAEFYSSINEGLIAASQIYRDAMAKCKRENPMLLLVAEQNMRRVFSELKRQGEPNVRFIDILENAPNVRVARLRFSNDDEAPFCVPGKGHSKYQGLYGHEDYSNVFYSLHNLSDAVAKPSIKHRKLNAMGLLALNPSTVQIWLNNLQPDDIPEEWAALVHRLRLESSHTDTATVRPQPMHDLRLFEKYLHRLIYEKPEEAINDLTGEET
jgi:hypothetical protein